LQRDSEEKQSLKINQGRELGSMNQGYGTVDDDEEMDEMVEI